MSGALPAVIAVDGGNSKSDLALVAGDGTLLASARGPGITKPDLAATLGLLTSLIDQAQRQIGEPGCPVARHLSACVANADLPEEEQALTAALCAQGWSDTTEVVNDTFAVLRAGFVTPKHIGTAVVRNRVRRRLRDIVRTAQPRLIAGLWLVMVARPYAATATYQQLKDEWLRLAERASILAL